MANQGADMGAQMQQQAGAGGGGRPLEWPWVGQLQELRQAAEQVAAKVRVNEAQQTLEVLAAAMEGFLPRGDKEALFSYLRGHTYECPNGHIYMIGNCGMANEASRCPECGAPIGGAGYHQLASGNTAADGFLQSLRAQV